MARFKTIYPAATTVNRIDNIMRMRDTALHTGHLAAMRASVNQSRLKGFDFLIMHAIGRNAWNKGINSPVNLDVYASECAYQAEVWRIAMRQMEAFYQRATRRTEIKF